MDKKEIRADPCPCKRIGCRDKPCPNGDRPCPAYIAWNKRNFGR